jgi:hypothetical protein
MVIRAAVRSRQALKIVGPPGIGKTSVVCNEASRLELPAHVVSCALLDPVDAGGIPVVDRKNGRVLRYPLGPIREVCERPGILFLDEINLASPAVQASVMRGVLERQFGDSTLHRDSTVLLAANPPGQAAGSFELSAPLINRLTVVQMLPNTEEVQAYFRSLGDESSQLRKLGEDLAGMLDHFPELLQLEPPDGAARPWGSPRAWERALRMLEGLVEEGEGEASGIAIAVLGGCVGLDAADVFTSQRRSRSKTPSMGDIRNDPDRAPMPAGIDGNTAVLAVLARIAKVDPNSAWIYASRLPGEAQAAALHVLLPFKPGRPSRQNLGRAVKARNRMIGSLGAAIAGSAV